MRLRLAKRAKSRLPHRQSVSIVGSSSSGGPMKLFHGSASFTFSRPAKADMIRLRLRTRLGHAVPMNRRS